MQSQAEENLDCALQGLRFASGGMAKDFLSRATDIATCMYYTGLDPFTKEKVYVARQPSERKLQRALLQFFKPENYFEVRQALIEGGRRDLIGNGSDALIPAQPPQEALLARRQRREVGGQYVHTIPSSASKKGYRPGRQTARRQKSPGRKHPRA